MAGLTYSCAERPAKPKNPSSPQPRTFIRGQFSNVAGTAPTCGTDCLCPMLIATWGSNRHNAMRRLIATSLLLFALFGSVLPLAQALSAQPLHACCLRKGRHQCHEAGSDTSSQPIFRDAGCCRGDCFRAVTSARWAHAQPTTAFFSLPALSPHAAGSQLTHPAVVFSGVRSSRAPPVSWNWSI